MSEDFVTFELAKKLKEKGFRELCLAYYTNDDTLYYNYSHKAGACYKDCYLSHNLMPKDSVSGKFVDAPTISQVLKWIRLEKNIHICIDIYETGWFFCINKNIDTDYETFSYDIEPTDIEYYDCYDSAVLRGIAYVIDNLI